MNHPSGLKANRPLLFLPAAKTAESDHQMQDMILSILVDTFISKISLPMQPVPEIRSISGA